MVGHVSDAHRNAEREFSLSNGIESKEKGGGAPLTVFSLLCHRRITLNASDIFQKPERISATECLIILLI